MSARYRVALHGFSEFERTTLTFCFRHAAAREPGYVQVALIADSDFIVADASHGGIAGSQTRGERMRDTLFVGDRPPLGATAYLRRPIDPERILRALDQMAANLGTRGRDSHNAPDIVLPLDAAESRLPALYRNDIVDTTPAAFQHEPVSITFTDLATFNAVNTTPGVLYPEEVVAHSAAPAAPATDAPPPRPPRPPVRALVKPPRPAALSAAERAEAKAAARRASRRARQLQAAASGVETPPDVLLLNGRTGPVGLSVLLEAFGFVVHHANGMTEAMAVLARTPLAAAFIDVAVEDPTGIDGLELCQQIKERQLALAGAVPAVMLVASRDSATGRVRAKLAGCDAFLAGAVTRGEAARALEACNIALPADARRA